MERKAEYHCSFCGKSQTKIKKLIAHNNVFICDECVAVCWDVIKGEAAPSETTESIEAVETKPSAPKIPSPREVKNFLDEYVIGQDAAKIKMAVAVTNHFKRIHHPVVEGVEIGKSNMLMVGPTGSGKTLIAETIARMLDVPIVIADATSLTEAGYVGEDVESIITRLAKSASYDIEKMQRGIVFIDEIDKKRAKSPASGGRDISGESVQQGLLKMLEGTEVAIPGPGGKKMGETVRVSTKNMLFIVSGAFVGLDKIIEADSKPTSTIGFGVVPRSTESTKTSLQNVTADHLTKYGLIPELVGRLPVIAVLDELTEEQMVHVMTEPKNAITKQFQALFDIDCVGLEFTDAALKEIAKRALKRKTGARGLRDILETALTDLQFRLPDLIEDGVEKIIVGDDLLAGGSAELVKG